MRKLLAIILFAGTVPLRAVDKPVVTQTVTVAQLQQFLSDSRGIEDSTLAKQIYDLKLTQRLSDADLARFEKELPGPNSWLALTAIADESAFLSLPPAEIPTLPSPNASEQAALLAKVNQYVTNTIKKLPDFYATRVTYHLKGTADRIPHDLRERIYPDLGNYRDQRLYPMDKTSVTVLNRREHEVLSKGEREIAGEKSTGVTPGGEFGPILIWVQTCMHVGEVNWSSWGFGELERWAIFRFSCSGASLGGWVNSGSAAGIGWGTDVVVDGLGANGPPFGPWARHPLAPVAIDGEIGVDPVNGSIRRLAIVGNGRFPDSASKAGLLEQWEELIDYGPVEIGGMAYICPMKSAMIEKKPDAEFIKPRSLQNLNRKYGLAKPLQIEYLSDSVFEHYHMFRANTKILPGFEITPNSGSAPSFPGGSTSAPATPPQK